MKRIGKIFAILATALLIFSTVGIFALAGDTDTAAVREEKAAISEGKFLYYRASTDTATELDNSLFSSTVSGLKNGDAIVFLSNLHMEDTYYIAPKIAGTAYIDFNGYRFSVHGDQGSRYVIQPQQGSTLYFCSSDNEYKAQIFMGAINGETGEKTAIHLTNTRVKDTHVYIGDATVPSFEKDGNNGWALKSNTVADGDNIEFFGSSIFSSYINNQANPQNSSFNINGGSYYNVYGGTMITNYSGVDINVNDAKFSATKALS